MTNLTYDEERDQRNTELVGQGMKILASVIGSAAVYSLGSLGSATTLNLIGINLIETDLKGTHFERSYLEGARLDCTHLNAAYVNKKT